MKNNNEISKQRQDEIISYLKKFIKDGVIDSVIINSMKTNQEVEDEEILILMDDNGHIILFANEEYYFNSKLYHVYPSMLKEMFGEHLILHIDDKEIEI